jgi:GNAT superfamily N-acetyltransferase
MARFLARRGGQVVGRIAAMVDPQFVQRWEVAGFFGFFECEDDVEAAAALLRAAEAFVAGQGLRRMLGPVNLSTHDEVGFLVAGYDSPPRVLSPYNPRFYPRLVEAAGYRAGRHYDAYLWTPAAVTAPAVARVLRRAAAHEGAGPRLRHLDPARWDDELRRIFAVYNEAFADLWGFVPIGWDEFHARANEFRSFYRPELVIIAEVAEQVVGFGLVLPDINGALRPLKGRLFPFGMLRLARAVPRVRTGRFILLGVLPGHSGRGLAALISHAMAEAGRALGMHTVELSLVQDGNAAMRHVIDAFAAPPVKRYCLFEKTLSGSAA